MKITYMHKPFFMILIADELAFIYYTYKINSKFISICDCIFEHRKLKLTLALSYSKCIIIYAYV